MSVLPFFFFLPFLTLAVTRTLNEQKKVQADREKAEADLSECLARLDRLRKQEALVRARGFELFERGMQEEDELISAEADSSAVLER